LISGAIINSSSSHPIALSAWAIWLAVLGLLGLAVRQLLANPAVRHPVSK